MAEPVRVVDPLTMILNDVLLPYQREVVLSDARFGWHCWSRQTGKSFGLTFRRIVRGIARKRNQLILSAGGRQSREVIMKAKQHCQGLDLAFKYSEREAGMFDGAKYNQYEIDLPEAGIRIIGLPANPETARGFTGDVFLDEFAMHAYDREIWGAMFPSVMRGGGELDVASTPRGKLNKFYELADNSQFAHNTLTINDAVEQGLTGIDVEELREAMGDELLYRQEFLCEFVDEASAFITLDMIRACEDEACPRTLDLKELAEHKGDVLVGVDIGRHHDLTVIWALEAVGEQLRTLGLIELKAKPFREQFETLSKVLKCRAVRKCAIDNSGLGMQLAEDLVFAFGANRVEPHTFSANVKEALGAKLRVKMEGQLLTIPVDRLIRQDLHSVEKSVTIDGHVRLRATRKEGSHADRFWALALAVFVAADNVGPVEAMFGDELCFAEGAW